MTVRRATPLAVLALWLSACATPGPSSHALHLVDDELVYSAPPSTGGYAAYLRCRLALDANPPRLEEARELIDQAIATDHRDPLLWTVRAEIDAQRGHTADAMVALQRALRLRPDYPPAKALAAHLGQVSPSAAKPGNGGA